MISSILRPVRVLAAVAALNAFALAGCQTFSSRETIEDTLRPPGNPIIGYVVWVDHADNAAVVRLTSGISPSFHPMIARNDAMIETARLEATATRQGNTLGVRILNGFPNSGDEVVLLSTPD